MELERKKKIRRGRGGKQKMFLNNDTVNKWMIYHLNIRGLKSKSPALCSIINSLDADVVSLNEHGLKNKQKMKIDGFKSYTKNRFNSNMGGVSLSVKDSDSQDTLKVGEGKGDNEYIITRHNQFYPAINIINVYGCQKNAPVAIIEEKWNTILGEVLKIEMKGENVLLLGDMNVAIGNDDLGVRGNDSKVSYGGQIIRNFLKDGKYILVNNLNISRGGPYTRCDPADKNKKSCLSLVIASKSLIPFIESLEIDKDNINAPSKATKTRRITSDHFPVIVTFRNLPKNKRKSIRNEVHTVWNTTRPEGWATYKLLSSDSALLDAIANDDKEDATETLLKIKKAQEKIKYQAFEKIKISNKGKPDPELKKLYDAKNNLHSTHDKTEARDNEIEDIEVKIGEKLREAQRVIVEKEIDEMRDAGKKGKCGAIFKLKAKVTGEKKEAAEAISIKDPDNGNMLYDPEEIKVTSLKYCQNLLKDRKPDEEYSFEVKIRELLHDVRMEEIVENDDHEDFTIEDFNKTLEKLKKKSKEKYKFILMAGDSMKKVLFRLFRNIWWQEKRPNQWKSTTIIQLYKGKGEVDDLNNHRNIHTKDDLPKAFETTVVDYSKPKIVSKCSKFQIGGMPGHRPTEHLFCIKSTMALYEQLDIPLIIQTFDISKYFDSEVLRDAMSALYEAGVKGKLYRLWYELNKETEIKVKTGVGTTKAATVGETVAQGSIGGGLASSLNLDVEVNNFFSGSINEAAYSDVRLQPMILQDDLSRLCCSAESARDGARRMENIMKLKQLTINVDKSSYIVCRKSTEATIIRASFEIKPLTYDGTKIKEKISEKYLGDMISGLGLAESIESTISERYGRIYASILEIKTILEDYRSSKAGGITAGIMLWEMAIIPSLLNNAETWTEIDSNSLKRLNDLQNMMLRILFNSAKTTPKPILFWDTGVLPIEYKIEIRKLTFIHHLISLPAESLANQLYIQQKNNNFPGLVGECQNLIRKYSLPDITSVQNIPTKNQWKKLVKANVMKYFESEIRNEIKDPKKYKKLKEIDVENESLEAKPYLSELNLSQARTKFKLRSRMLEIKNNFKGEYIKTNLECDACENSIETQDHLLFCPAYRELRKDMDINNDKDLVNYVREVMRLRDSSKKKK